MKILLLFNIILLLAACNPASRQTEQQAEQNPLQLFFPQKPSQTNIVAAADPQTALSFIKTTGRISSNHYADLVVDPEGNSYIACFQKKEDDQDYILLTKVSPQGYAVWESGTQLKGRATAITMDRKGHIWVTGHLTESLNPSIQRAACIFIARFDPEGNCKQLITSQGSGLSFNIHVNRQNELLLNGIMGSELSFGETKLKNKSGEDTGFLALFDSNGQIRWMKTIQGEVGRIRSDAGGNFYLTGKFQQQLAFEKDTIRTDSRFDQDGFLLKISQDDQDSWLRQFGQKGVLQYGYATQETGSDLIITRDDRILVAAMMNLHSGSLPKEEQTKSIDLVLLEYDSKGALMDQHEMVRHLARGTGSCFIQDANGHLWMSGHARPFARYEGQPLSSEPQQRSFLLQVDAQKKVREILLPRHKTNMLFRAAAANEDRVFFSGHFQQLLEIADQKITNDGRHGLFLFIQKI